MRLLDVSLHTVSNAMLLLLLCFAPLQAQAQEASKAVTIATDGHLKMLYDNRMHPAAIGHDGQIYITWRGDKGYPQVRSYDLESREFSDQVNILTGLEDVFDVEKYTRDQHYNPVIWKASDNHFNIIAGCHGNSPRRYSDCDKMRSKKPGDINSGWEKVDSTINISVNYPKAYRIFNDQTLMHFRNGGHLGSWTYRVSPDGTYNWKGPENDLVDLNGMDPYETPMPAGMDCLDYHAGSYHSIRISHDGKTMHNSFVWAQQDFEDAECNAPLNMRYGPEARDTTGDNRYNMYYTRVDLTTGKAYNYAGKELKTPIRRAVADADAKIYDSDERIFAVAPSMSLGKDNKVAFLGAVSEETAYRSWFVFFYYKDGEWKNTKIARTSHVFNASLLRQHENGDYTALLIVGEGEAKIENRSKEKRNLSRYGWGDRVEEWISKDGGQTWTLNRDITPIKGFRYQNIKRVAAGIGESLNNIILFHGWPSDGKPGSGHAFLLDDRK